MKTAILMILALAVLNGVAAGQAATPADSAMVSPTPAADSTLVVIPSPAASTPAPSKIYYGGSVTLSFGNATQIGIFPMIGYKVSPKFSLGGEIGYEYVNYDDFDESSHNFGGGVFGRYRFIPQLYGHAEVDLVSYDIPALSGESSREAVPFVLLGGGFVQPLSPRTSLFAEVLVDVLQDDNSPYDDWEPIFSIGVGVGF
jgi:hypothetical protein